MKIRIKGPETGKPFRINVADRQGATGSWGQIPEGGVGEGSLVVIIERETQMPLRGEAEQEVYSAPAGIRFRAVVTNSPVSANSTDTYDALHHEVHYFWNFGESWLPGDPDAEFTVAQNIFHKDRNSAIGRYTSHVYRTPGTYTVSVLAVDDLGNWGTAETTVIVEEAEYAPSQTILVSPAGIFDDGPEVIAANKIRTWTALGNRMADLKGQERLRILFRRGETIVANTMSVRASEPATYFGAYGPDAAPKPVIDTSECGSYNHTTRQFWGWKPIEMTRWNVRGMVIQDLRFESYWNPEIESWLYGKIVGTAIGGGHTNSFCLVDNCEADGLNKFVHPGWDVCATPNGRAPVLILHELKTTNFADFLLMHGSGMGISVIGCSAVQNPDGANGASARGIYGVDDGGAGRGPGYDGNSHGGVRSGWAREIEIANCDFAVNQGWTNYIFYNNSCVRLNTDGRRDQNAVIARNNFESHISQEEVNGGADTYNYPGNYLVEQNYFTADPTLSSCISTGSSGWTIRNNIFVVPDVNVTYDVGGFAGPIVLKTWGEFEGRDANPVRVYNNTMIVEKAGDRLLKSFSFVKNDANFSKLIEDNNIKYCPDKALTGDGPFDKSSLGWNGRCTGLKKTWERIGGNVLGDLTSGQDVPPGGSVLVPYASSLYVGWRQHVAQPLPRSGYAYWSDWYGQPLTQASFADAHNSIRHYFQVGNKAYDGWLEDATFAFEEAGVRVTNASAATWPAASSWMLFAHRRAGAMARDTSFATPPGTFSLYRPLPGSAAIEGATSGPVALVDFRGWPRPGTKHPDAPAGIPSRGAMEPREI